jgi:hypothetical protein
MVSCCRLDDASAASVRHNERGSAVRSIPIPTTGDIIAGKYRLDETLGRGGFGIVFKATHLEMNRPVALKTLLPQVAALPTAAERFRREAVLASSLTHPNSITLFDYGQTPDGVLYLVMELLRGKTLSQHLGRQGAMPVARAQTLVVQILKSLAEAHAQGIVHLDMKPGNLFLCDVPGEQDFVKVLDFGVARMFMDPRAANLSESLAMGTPRYMAPEQITGEPVGPETDLYALGLIGYEMLMGQPAYTGRTPLEIVALQLNQPAPRLPERLLQTSLGGLVDRLTQKAPAARCPNAAAALELLLGEASPAWSVLQGGAAGRPAAKAAAPLFHDEDEAGPTRVHREVNYLEEGSWPSVDDRALQQEMEGAATVVHALHEDPSLRLLAEAPLALGDEGDLDLAKTRVRDGFDEQPTQAVMVIDGDDLVEMIEGTGAVAAISIPDEPTREEPTARPLAPSEDTPAPPDSLEGGPAAISGGLARVARVQAKQRLPQSPRASGESPALPPQSPRDSGDLRRVSPQERAARDRPRQPDAPGLSRGVLVSLGVLGVSMAVTLAVVLGGVLWMISQDKAPALAQAPAPSQPVEAPPQPVATAQPAAAAQPPAQPVEMPPPEPERRGARLNLTSEPRTAQVFVGGRFAGTTPLVLPQDAEQGALTVVVKLDGHLDETMEIDYKGDKSLHVQMKKKPLAVTPAPRPAALANNGAAQDKPSPRPAAQDKPAPVAPSKPAAQDKPAPVAPSKPAAQDKPKPTPQDKPAPTPKKKVDPMGKW